LKKPTNTQIADVLERIAEVLDVQDANPFRVRAYRQGADTVRYYDQPVADFIRQDRLEDLKALPNIGDGIAAVIGEYVSSGQSNLLKDLEAEAGPEAVFVQVPGIGKELAERITEQLHIKTLPELEEAAHDGRLETVEGFGHRRAEGVRAALAGMLKQDRHSKENAQEQEDDERPSVELLLEIDSEYRRRAQADELHKISPRRFNPDDEVWLPVMHVKRQGWDFTVLFSNTAQAHRLNKTDDWVVIYYERDDHERQNTVVTETQGPLKGRRVVRGRAAENQEYYTPKAVR
jgi:DNA polymerase (family 10)